MDKEADKVKMKTFTKLVKIKIRAYNEHDAEEQLEDMMQETWADSWEEEFKDKIRDKIQKKIESNLKSSKTKEEFIRKSL